jgi:hypothetical protein
MATCGHRLDDLLLVGLIGKESETSGDIVLGSHEGLVFLG